MRVVLSLSVLLLSAGASGAPPHPTAAPDQPSIKGLPNAIDRSSASKRDTTAVCRGRINEARQAGGLPKLQREPADNDKPLLIYAVDRMIDGCEVLVMRNDLSDIRPLPTPAGPARLRPAH